MEQGTEGLPLTDVSYTDAELAALRKSYERDPEAFKDTTTALGVIGDRRDAASAEGRRVLYARDIQAMAYGLFPHYFEQERGQSEFHREMWEFLRSLAKAERARKAGFAAPRGHAKSTFGARLLPAACCLHPEEYGIHYIVIVRATYKLAEKDVCALRDELGGTGVGKNPHTQNEAIRELYGDLKTPDWNKGAFVVRNGDHLVRVEACGAEGNIRGLLWGHRRPDLIIVDDLDKDAKSADHRRQMLEWLQGAVAGLGDVKHGAHVLCLGTLLAKDAVIAWCTGSKPGQAPGWFKRIYQSVVSWPDELDGMWRQWERLYNEGDAGPWKARAFYEANRDAMEAGGEVLWPGGESLYANMVYRCEWGPTAHSREKQNDPMTSAGKMLAASDIVWWGGEDDDVQFVRPYDGEATEHDPMLGLNGISCDPAWSDADTADTSAIVRGGLTDEGIVYVRIGDIRRRMSDDLEDQLLDAAERDRPDWVAVESEFAQALILRNTRKKAKERGISAPVSEIKTEGVSKPLRLLRLQAPVRGGLIRFHRVECRQLVDQLLAIRSDGTWRKKVDGVDGPDALEMLWRRFSKGRPARLQPQEGRNGDANSFGDFGGIRPGDLFGGGAGFGSGDGGGF